MDRRTLLKGLAGAGSLAATGGTITITAAGGATTALAQANTVITTQSIIPANRVTLWQPGVTYNGGIPNRTTICTTINASTFGNGSSDATAGIQSALNGCASGLHFFVGAISIRSLLQSTIEESSVTRGTCFP